MAQSRVQAMRAKAANRAKQQVGKGLWKPKRFDLAKGDMVQFHTANPHMLGGMGIVLGWLNKNEVLVRTLGGMDTDYPPIVISLRAQKVNDGYNGSKGQPHYQNYVEKIVWRVAGKKARKKRTPIRFYEVTPDVLPDVLAGTHEVPEGHKVVLVDAPVPEQDRRDAFAQGFARAIDDQQAIEDRFAVRSTPEQQP